MTLARIQILAAQAIVAVTEQGKNLQDVLTALWKTQPNLLASEKGALQDITYGCHRYLGSLRFMLGKMLDKPIKEHEVESLLLVALYQLNYTRNAPYAVVNEGVPGVCPSRCSGATVGQGRWPLPPRASSLPCRCCGLPMPRSACRCPPWGWCSTWHRRFSWPWRYCSITRPSRARTGSPSC